MGGGQMHRKPFVIYGTQGNPDAQKFLHRSPKILGFHIMDPELYIPLNVPVYTCVYNHTWADECGDKEERWGYWGLPHFYERFAANWCKDDTLLKLVLKLMFAEGLDRLWVTTNVIAVQGDPRCYGKLTEVIKIALSEIFGELHFEDAGEGGFSGYVAKLTEWHRAG